MILPDATQIAAAYTFASAVWSGFAIFGTLFALVAAVKAGSWLLRIMRKAIPG